MRTIFILCIGFVVGYFSRDYILSHHYATTIKQAVLGEQQIGQSDTFISEMIYENNNFSPGRLIVRKGNYLTITNLSDTLMWLTSDNPSLTTPRGLGNSEQIRVKANIEGTFTIKNKLHDSTPAVITIVP